MSALPTLKSSGDFQRVSKLGRRLSFPTFILQALKTDSAGPLRVGYTASRKVGNAVIRNRAKRRLREVVRLLSKEKMLSGGEIVLIAKTAAASADFAVMQRDFGKAMTDLGFAS